ncbi:iron ABC transporter permease [Thermostilla marina]
MRRADWILLVSVPTAVAVLAGAPLVGMHDVPLHALWHDDGTASRILWELRIPRVWTGFVVGAVLAAGGVAFQAMFRNPLATPFTLGIAGGASLGAAVAIFAGWSFTLGWLSGGAACAFLGAVATIVLVYGLTRIRAGFSTATLLLAGVALNFFYSSAVIVLQYLADPSRTYRMFRWMLGGLEGVVGFTDLKSVLVLAVPCLLCLAVLPRELNLLITGEELAAARGVAVDRIKIVVFTAVSLMVAAVVAVCGPIGFVGLIVPHVCRLLLGPDHRRLLPGAMIAGGTFLVICDTVARTVVAPTELPVGVITAMLGGPFFLLLLLTRGGESAV